MQNTTGTAAQYEGQMHVRGRTVHVVKVDHLMATVGRGSSTGLCGKFMSQSNRINVTDLREMDLGYGLCRTCFAAAMPSQWGRDLTDAQRTHLTGEANR